MPPSSAFGWLYVVHSVADIAFRAAQIRSAQALRASQTAAKENGSSIRTDTHSASERYEKSTSPGELEVVADGQPSKGPSSAMENDVSTCSNVQGTNSVS